MVQTTQKTWLGNLIAKVAAFFSGASNGIHDITVIADNIANTIKNSPLTGLLENALEMVIPASTGLVEAFKLELPNIVEKLNWALAAESKTPDALVIEGLAYLKTLKGTDDYVIQLNSFAAKVQKWFSDNLGYGLTIQAALLTPQIVHDPALLNIANSIVSDAQKVSNIVNEVVDETAAPGSIPAPAVTG